MFKLILLILLFTGVNTFADQGIVTDYIRMNPTSLPSACRVGDIRFNSSGNVPAFCKSSNSWQTSISPITTLGDMIYGGASGINTRLPGNTTSTKNFLTQTGTGAVSAAPAWGTIQAADLPTIAISGGGTGQTSKAAAFDALSPMTTGGDIIYGGASGTATRLANGTAGQILTSQGSTLAPIWSSMTAASPTSVKTSNYTVQTTDGTVRGDSSGGTFTFTLFTPVGNSGLQVTLLKTDTTFTQIPITGTGLSGQTLARPGERVTFQSDGTNWIVLTRTIPSNWTDQSSAFTTTGVGTPGEKVIFVRAVGDSAEIRGWFNLGVVTNTDMSLDFASVFTIDNNKFSTSTNVQRIGSWNRIQDSLGADDFAIFYDGSDNNSIYFALANSADRYDKVDGNAAGASGDRIGFTFTVPILGWNP